MEEIAVVRIGPERAADVNLPNEPFTQSGRFVPELHEGVWSYRIDPLPEKQEIRFPDCPYDVEEEDTVFFGAYRKDTCVGLAVLRKQLFRYLYLDDLKVCKAYRGAGTGSLLIRACLEEAKRQGMQGVYTIAQDDNVPACRFYLKCGFAVGGFDNRSYRGTKQEQKADVFFYLDC